MVSFWIFRSNFHFQIKDKAPYILIRSIYGAESFGLVPKSDFGRCVENLKCYGQLSVGGNLTGPKMSRPFLNQSVFTSETKTNFLFVAPVFPRLGPATCICFDL